MQQQLTQYCNLLLIQQKIWTERSYQDQYTEMTDTSGGSPVRVVDDSVSLATHDAADRDSFPFFDLPPELRNIIYSFSVKNTEPFQYSGSLGIKLLGYFRPSLQRVCKQFRYEYENEVLKSAAVSSFLQPSRDLYQRYSRRLPCLRALTMAHLHMNHSHYRSLGMYPHDFASIQHN